MIQGSRARAPAGAAPSCGASAGGASCCAAPSQAALQSLKTTCRRDKAAGGRVKSQETMAQLNERSVGSEQVAHTRQPGDKALPGLLVGPEVNLGPG